jgi:cytochrome-b5 reductase
MSNENGILTKNEWVPLALSEKTQISKWVTLVKFALAEENHNLGCKAGEYVSVRATINGEVVVRYYSPLSAVENSKDLELAIKFDGVGVFSKYLSEMKLGEKLDFSGPIGGFQYESNKYPKLGLIAGGTGIAPMLQIIRKILGDSSDHTQIKLLYGAVEESELVFKQEIDWMARDSRLEVYYTLDRAPEGWKHGAGYLTKDVFAKQLPGKDWQLVVCGPGKMGEIMDKILLSMDGFTEKNVFNFARKAKL